MLRLNELLIELEFFVFYFSYWLNNIYQLSAQASQISQIGETAEEEIDESVSNTSREQDIV